MVLHRSLVAGLGSFVLLAGLLATAPAAFAILPVIYVDASASGTGDGSSWTDAFPSLADALPTAVSGQIWVADGTYKPTTADADPRNATFQLANGVAVYGGFAGTETARSQRDWSTNIAILSGDIGTAGDASDNSYHVVTGATGGTLDGFVVTKGNADDFSSCAYFSGGCGGGILNSLSNPTLANLSITDNLATGGGAGIYNDRSDSPAIVNVIVAGNAPGGIFNYISSPTLTNVAISGNSGQPGLANLDGSNPTLVNVTITGNSTTTQGAGIFNASASSPTIRNSIVWGNSAPLEPDLSNFDPNPGDVSAPVITYSNIGGGYAGVGNQDEDPLFTTPVSGTLPNTSGVLTLQAASGAINSGDPADTAATLGVGTDLAGSPRISGGRVDMGAYEADSHPPTFGSANHATFTVGSAGTFTVTTSGGVPSQTSLSKTGALPAGLTFHDNHNGTATIAGTPAAGTGGSYPLTIKASNGVSPDAAQAFTLTVNAPTTRPDGLIKLSGSNLLGNNIYNTTGAGQTFDGNPRNFQPGGFRTFHVYVYNDSAVKDKFTFLASGLATAGYSVSYWTPSGDNVTAQVEAGTFTTRKLNPGGHYGFKVRVDFVTGISSGSSFSRLLTITSVNNSTYKDAVGFVLRKR